MKIRIVNLVNGKIHIPFLNAYFKRGGAIEVEGDSKLVDFLKQDSRISFQVLEEEKKQEFTEPVADEIGIVREKKPKFKRKW